ncbi:hypothetical protein BKE38_05325 [Pseudoroseomonas deserti]|uniref:STAS domain-containing protein n=1 Tax=Teichococcus deserti TaxID=1817963 RepID=A0A1V2H618_9PROT|nr:hypothetical protein [Pseudoroseomonas deserti]ONG56745.1 hypothetical protein BKE38_05325 [Pseudoroseomonas deserti]
MSIALEDGRLRLAGDCGVEEAETFLSMLQQHPGLAVDLAEVAALHTALLQVLLAFRPPLAAAPGEPGLARLLLPLLGR